MNTFKIVDESSNLSLTKVNTINTKDELYNIIKEYLDKLFLDKNEDEILFWATYSMFIVENDCIYLCSRIGVTYPIYDVFIEKSEETNIKVTPYKLDGIDEYYINNLSITVGKGMSKILIHPEDYNKIIIFPSDVLNLKYNKNQHWKGEIYIRGPFTGWNYIYCNVNISNILKYI